MAQALHASVGRCARGHVSAHLVSRVDTYPLRSPREHAIRASSVVSFGSHRRLPFGSHTPKPHTVYLTTDFTF